MVKGVAQRFTTTTTLRNALSLQAFAPGRTSWQALHSSAIWRGEKKPKDESSLSALVDLAGGFLSPTKGRKPSNKSEETTRRARENITATGPDRSHRPRAYIEPPQIRTYEHRDVPTWRWSRIRYGQTGGHDRTANAKIVWRDHHRSLLKPPTPAGYLQTYSRRDYVAGKMRSFVQLLTAPTADTPGTTVVLHFDNKRYLFGSLAEGTQRACVQMGARLLKVSECFLTGRTEWSNTGGLIGMILTLADSSHSSQASSLEEAMKKVKAKAKKLGIEEGSQQMQELEDEAKQAAGNALTIFGPPNLNYTLATARRYVFRKGMPINVHEIRDSGLPKQIRQEGEDWKPLWADENIKVWAMSILPSKSAITTPPASVSPRKRSFDEMHANGTTAAPNASDMSQEDSDSLTVKAVVGEMFNSSWRLDTLYETALCDVKLPAAIFVRSAQTQKVEKYTGPLPGDNQNPPEDPQLKVLVRRPWPGALVESLPDTTPAQEALSYIVRNHMQRGKFHPMRAKALKVKSGPDFAKLSKGESVQNEDGETVTPEQVMDPSRVGGGIAVVDLPSAEYIDNLLLRPEWRDKQVMDGVGAIIWICGEGVASDQRIHAFMQEFSHLEHVVSSAEYCPNNIALDSVAASTTRLQRVDPMRYVAPVHDETSTSQQRYGGSAQYLAVRENKPLPKHVHIAARGQVIQLEPCMEFQTKDAIPAIDIAEAAAGVAADVMEEAVKAQSSSAIPDEAVKKWIASLPPGAQEADVTTLGTGSALPSKYRNVSSTLVRVPVWGNILLDAGENTIGQLKRVFAADEYKQVLRDLRMICISHMHADHQLGTTSIVKAWYQECHNSQPAPPVSVDSDWSEVFANRDRLAIVSEPAMQHWLHEYSSVEDYGYSRLAPLFITPADPYKGQASRLGWFVPPTELKHLSAREYKAKMDAHTVSASLLNLADIQAVAVKHCHGARAISVTLPSGFKISYSGDCRPSKSFAMIGKGSTVCVHEATFDDELQGDAEAKNHSTTSEALDIAQRMGAKACVLTHFSQRYQKVPVLERDDSDPPVEEDTAMMSGVHTPMVEDESSNPEDVMLGPHDDVAATFPDQETSNGASGKQYDILSKKQSAVALSRSAPEAVKFKLNSDMKVCVAFDYMRVKVGEIWQLEHFTPALLKLFAEEEMIIEAGTGSPGTDNPAKADKKEKKQKQEKSKRFN